MTIVVSARHQRDGSIYSEANPDVLGLTCHDYCHDDPDDLEDQDLTTIARAEACGSVLIPRRRI